MSQYVATRKPPRTVVDLKPDVILLATGAEPYIPPIPGLTPDSVLLAEQALQQDNRTPDGTILIIGGELAGCETALHLAQKGYSPLVVEMREALCIDTEPRSRAVLLNYLEEYGVRSMLSCRISSIDEHGATICKQGQEEKIICSGIILATGYTPRTQLADALANKGIRFYSIGDCTIMVPESTMPCGRQTLLLKCFEHVHYNITIRRPHRNETIRLQTVYTHVFHLQCIPF